MKNLNLTIIAILFSILSSFSQTSAVSEAVTTHVGGTLYSGKHTLHDGRQKININSSIDYLIITVNKSKITAIKRTINNRTYDLKLNNDGSTSNGMDCPCGYNCWEDEALQQSICVCQGCSGSGNGIGFFDVFVDID